MLFLSKVSQHGMRMIFSGGQMRKKNILKTDLFTFIYAKCTMWMPHQVKGNKMEHAEICERNLNPSEHLTRHFEWEIMT